MDLPNYIAQKVKGLVTIQKVGPDTALVVTPTFHAATGDQIGQNADQLNLKGIDDALADLAIKRALADASFDANQAALTTLRTDIAKALA